MASSPPRGGLNTLSPTQAQENRLLLRHHEQYDASPPSHVARAAAVPLSLRSRHHVAEDGGGHDDYHSPQSGNKPASNFDWPELRAIRPIPPPSPAMGEMSATSSLEPIANKGAGKDAAAGDVLSPQGAPQRSRSPTQGIARLSRLAVPRHQAPLVVRHQPHPPPLVAGYGNGGGGGEGLSSPLPPPPHPFVPKPIFIRAAPSAVAAVSATSRSPTAAHRPRHLPALHAPLPSVNDNVSPPLVGPPPPPLAAVAPRLQHELDDYDRHRRRAQARSAAVDKRVQSMLKEIEKQRETIERVIERQDHDFEQRLQAQHAQLAVDFALREQRVKQRQGAHLERLQRLKTDRKVHAVPPLASGPGRFGPDRAQPAAAAVARGTSIGLPPAPSPDLPQQRSPSPLRQSSPIPTSPPQLLPGHGGAVHPPLMPAATSPSPSPSVARIMTTLASEQDVVHAAEERFRRAEAERAEAERALKLAQRRAVATRLLETQRAAAEILEGPLRMLQAYVSYQLSLRAARTAALRVEALRAQAAAAAQVRRRSSSASTASSEATSSEGDDEDDDEETDGENTEDENLDYQSEPTTRTTLDGSPAVLSTVPSEARMHQQQTTITTTTSSAEPTAQPAVRPRRRSVTIASNTPEGASDEDSGSASRGSPTFQGSGTVPPSVMAALMPPTETTPNDDDDPLLLEERHVQAHLLLVSAFEFALLSRMQEAYRAEATGLHQN